ncbi:hypothetical protein B484DRAFT_393118 [Ochromonadaceae sp. CCMP2298]|nr:hypothetical protein B484DRAFT_393118 [Ochromonadaceae sp. CCMP2298]
MLHIRALLLVALLLAACSEVSINSLTQLSYDENNRLSANYLLHSDTPECSAQMAAHVTHFREKLAVSKDLENQFFDGSQSACAAVCLEQGMEDIYVTHPLPKALPKDAGASPNGTYGLTEWLTGCQKVEVGFISYHPAQPLDLYWLNGKQARVSLGQVKWGEKNTVWQQTYLGHQFVLVDSVTQADVLALQITHDSVYATGTRASAVVERDVASQYNDGTRLLTHVDRESTHAASLIINVGQSLMREPWQLEIYDFADRLHEEGSNTYP